MSRAKLEEHRRVWRSKPVLARVYAPWFATLLDAPPRGSRVLEVGAGPGLLAEAAASARPDLRWVSSDLHAAPWNTLAADAGRLPLASRTVAAVVGVDVLHHLPDPAAFFREAARVLAHDGSVVLVEPWLSPLSWSIYRFFHQERCRLRVDPWHPFAAAKDSFDGDAAIPWRLVRTTAPRTWNALGLLPPSVERMNGFAYLLSLGFRRASLIEERGASVLLALDRRTRWLSRALAVRATLRWRRLRA